ncbi:ABC-2 type transport system permease protein [Aequitasia blattaphilus]|uniref:ABC transporter permease n=1 Tax=Aequitasia blattaphilus TaxID=2949332 RepID=A0ABT1E9V2_9FIRM|nr:ABC transporter permease [Aequitasia blattaphilus]MCP1101287.1 ABC transporter permease [Aequitasia blattaphilus]MCR8613927.1 ABC transporter permease [Aequitasia blattaphilus]
MTVFKGFLLLAKRNIGIGIMYLGIFLSIAIAIERVGGAKAQTSFEETSLKIGVVDEDHSELSQGLKEYLSTKHTVTSYPMDKSLLQDKLFYRDISYIIYIPENFEEKVIQNGDSLSVTKLPDSTSAIYGDQEIDAFLNGIRTLKTSGFSTSEAVDEMLDSTKIETSITLVDSNGNGGTIAPHSFYYQYMPYIMLAICCFIFGTIYLEYRNLDLKRRLLCSSISSRKQNMELLLGTLAVGFLLFLIITGLALILYGRNMTNDSNIWHYIANSFLLLVMSLSLAFLVGNLIDRENLLNPITNILSLGMAFLCGVFVPMEFLGSGVLTVAKFLPVYWYEIANDILAHNTILSASQMATLIKCYGIQLLFAAAFFSVSIVVSRLMQQKQ